MPPTSLIGRDAEVAAVRALLDPSGRATRLLTLLGAGGVGKTRLALAVTERLVDAFSDGVVIVDLAPLRDAPDQVATRIELGVTTAFHLPTDGAGSYFSML